MSDTIAVMHEGRIVEQGAAEDVYINPQSDYTRALLTAVPVPDPELMRARKAERRLEPALGDARA
jgi:ABC-type oligopeptide transport system ATPase subunit